MYANLDKLTLRISRKEKLALLEMALAEGEAMSVTLRRILREELKRRGFLDSGKEGVDKAIWNDNVPF